MSYVYPAVCSECGKKPYYYYNKEDELHVLMCDNDKCKYYRAKTVCPNNVYSGKEMCIQIWNQHQEFRTTMKKLFSAIDEIINSNEPVYIEKEGRSNGQFFEIIHPEYNRVEILFTDNKFTVIHNVIRIKIVDDTLNIIRYGDDMHFKLSNIKEYSMGPTRKEV